MAKNRDRRKDPKPKPAKGEPPPLRKARPDLMVRVDGKLRFLIHGERISPMGLAKELREHIDDVQDCLNALARQGGVVKSQNVFTIPPPRHFESKKREKLDPEIVLRMRRVFEKVGTASADDFVGVHDVEKYLEQLSEDGLVTRVGPVPLTAGTEPVINYCLSERRLGAPRSRWTPSRLNRGGNKRCPWCNQSVRRHARSEVHDPVQCRVDMIALIMRE